jgi:hypothetical protein
VSTSTLPQPVKSAETPTQRRSRQIDNLAATLRDMASAASMAAKCDVIRPLKQQECAQLKKNLETKLRTVRSLMEGMMS